VAPHQFFLKASKARVFGTLIAASLAEWFYCSSDCVLRSGVVVLSIKKRLMYLTDILLVSEVDCIAGIAANCSGCYDRDNKDYGHTQSGDSKAAAILVLVIITLAQCLTSTVFLHRQEVKLAMIC